MAEIVGSGFRNPGIKDGRSMVNPGSHCSAVRHNTSQTDVRRDVVMKFYPLLFVKKVVRKPPIFFFSLLRLRLRPNSKTRVCFAVAIIEAHFMFRHWFSHWYCAVCHGTVAI